MHAPHKTLTDYTNVPRIQTNIQSNMVMCIHRPEYESTTGGQHKRYNQSIKTQYFGKNENQNHSNKKTRLLSCASDARVSNDSNGKACCQATKSYWKTGSKLEKWPAKIGVKKCTIQHDFKSTVSTPGMSRAHHNTKKSVKPLWDIRIILETSSYPWTSLTFSADNPPTNIWCYYHKVNSR